MEDHQKTALDYRQSLTIQSTIEDVFDALTSHIDKWWSAVDHTADKEGTVFIVSFGPESYWTFKVIGLNKPESIIWECIDSHQGHHLPGMDEEWLNSKIFWNISSNDQSVKVDFLHEGLVTTGVCYEVCSSGWDFYILDSLKSFLETGSGKPGGN